MNGKEPYSLCSPSALPLAGDVCADPESKKKRLYNLQVLPSCSHLGKLRPRDGHSCYLSSCSGLGCACGQLGPLVRARLCPLLESPESAGNVPDLTCRPAHRQDPGGCRRDREGHPGGSWPTCKEPRPGHPTREGVGSERLSLFLCKHLTEVPTTPVHHPHDRRSLPGLPIGTAVRGLLFSPRPGALGRSLGPHPHP